MVEPPLSENGSDESARGAMIMDRSLLGEKALLKYNRSHSRHIVMKYAGIFLKIAKDWH
jgi:hypothetical protein